MGSTSMRFLPAHDEPFMTKYMGDELGDDHHGIYESQLV